MFFWGSKQRYKHPPPGWSRRPLTFWDCCQFACHDSPTIGWVLSGEEGVDTDILSSALQTAIRRRAPWLQGRLAKTESGSPPYELHVPPEDIDVMPFTRSVVMVEGNLNSFIRYVANETLDAMIDVLETFDPTVLNPRTSVKGVEDYISKDLPLLHLHFLKAADATLMSLSWSHAVMDALGCAQIIEAWEEELGEVAVTPCENLRPETLFDFTNNVTIPPGWSPPGWIQVTSWEIVKVFASYFYELYTLPRFHGSVFIPSALVNHWKKTAAEELPKDKWVSRNDLVSAWIFKSHVMPPITTRELRDISLAQLALRLRKSLDPYEDEEYVAKVVAHEVRSVTETNGKATSYPIGLVQSRPCGLTSWAKLGLGSPNFGDTITTISSLSYNARRGCATIIDSQCGNWRVDFKLSKKAWAYMNEQMEMEMQALKRPHDQKNIGGNQV